MPRPLRIKVVNAKEYFYCPGCNRYLGRIKFYNNKAQRYGIDTMCKECRAIYNRLGGYGNIKYECLEYDTVKKTDISDIDSIDSKEHEEYIWAQLYLRVNGLLVLPIVYRRGIKNIVPKNNKEVYND